MSWPRQVLHVLGKDLRAHRWLLAGFAAALALMVGLTRRVGSFADDPPFGPYVMAIIALHLFAMVVAAFAVHADSPHRADAFWRSRPIDSLALLAAKLLFLLLAVTLPLLVAQLGCLLWLGLPLVQAPPMLLVSAFALWLFLVPSLVVAVLTRSLDGFVVAFILLGVAGAVLASVFRWLDGGTLRSSLALPAVTLALPFVAYIYRVRHLGRVARAAGIAILLGLTGTFGASGATGYAAGKEAAPSVPRSAAHLDDVPRVGGSSDGSSLHLGLDLSEIGAAQHALLVSGTARLHLTNGSVVVTRIAPMSIPASEPALPPIRGIRWARDERRGPPPTGRRVTLRMPLSARQWRKLAVGVGRVDVEARVRVADAFVRGTMPAREGATLRTTARVSRVEQVIAGDRGYEIRVHSISVPSSDDRAFRLEPSDERSEWALVNHRLGEGLPVVSSTTGAGGTVSVVGMGAMVSNDPRQLQAESHDGANSFYVRSADWYRDAQLVLIGWRDLGSYTVRATSDLRGQAPEPIDPSRFR